MKQDNHVLHLITFDEMFGRPKSADILSTAYEYGHWEFTKKTKFLLNVLKAFRFVHNKNLLVPAYWLMNNPYLMILLDKNGKEFVEEIFEFITPKIRKSDKSTFSEMEEAYILGEEEQSSYWSDIRKLESHSSQWDEIKKKLIIYMDYLDDKYGKLDYIEKEVNFKNLLYDQILNKFENEDSYKFHYSFLEETSIASKVKHGIKNLNKEYEDFGMSKIVYHINLARNHEDNIFKIDCDEPLSQEIVSFCRGSYLWAYRFFLGLNFHTPNSHDHWKRKWEDDIHIELFNYTSDVRTSSKGFFDIESALIRSAFLEPLKFFEINEIIGSWPNNLNFKLISDKVLSEEVIDKSQKSAWDNVIDNLMDKLRWKKEDRSKLRVIMSNAFSTLFRKKNRENVIIQTGNATLEFANKGVASDLLLPYSSIKAFCQLAYGVSQIEKEERRDVKGVKGSSLRLTLASCFASIHICPDH